MKTQVLKVSTDYFKLAGKKGLSKGVCYNCLSGFHSASACPVGHCKFCKRRVDEVKHFSLGCALCPPKPCA